jgi:mRNA-degrading endonuclease RelE of RelBE toxin-antitoxin system
VPKYRLVFHRKAEKALDGLDNKSKQRLLEDILCLADFAERKSRLDIVKMAGQKDFLPTTQRQNKDTVRVGQAVGDNHHLKIEQRERAYE